MKKQFPLRLMRSLMLVLIRFYQHYVSPYKGFCCAYREHTGRASCSEFGYRVIRRAGPIGGVRMLRQRMYLCGVAHRRAVQSKSMRLASQRGFCDIGCDLPCDAGCHLPDFSGCELPSGRVVSDLCNVFSFCDCGSCDWPSRERNRTAEDESYVYIPPNSKRKTSQ